MKNIVINDIKKQNYSIRESFKALRTNFLFCGSENKVVLITSCVKNEGKSTVSIELSKSLALSEKKVLLIDADLRKSMFASKYTTNDGNILGLSEYLSGQAEYDDILYGTQNENLHLLFAGAVPPNPVELLGSQKFASLVKRARDEYDYIIIDAAPLGAVIDASVISTVCDGGVLVITANYIGQRFAMDVKEQLQKSGCKVLGAVLNRVPTKSGSYYNRYYKRYYGKYKRYGYGSKYGRYGRYGKYGRYGGYGKYGNYGRYGGSGTGYDDDVKPAEIEVLNTPIEVLDTAVEVEVINNESTLNDVVTPAQQKKNKKKSDNQKLYGKHKK